MRAGFVQFSYIRKKKKKTKQIEVWERERRGGDVRIEWYLFIVPGSRKMGACVAIYMNSFLVHDEASWAWAKLIFKKNKKKEQEGKAQKKIKWTRIVA